MNKMKKYTYTVAFRLPYRIDPTGKRRTADVEAKDDDEAEAVIVARHTDNTGQTPDILGVYEKVGD